MKKVIPIVFSSDENYINYLGVCIFSLIKHSSALNEYKIYILNDGNISENSKNKIFKMLRKNITIEFINIITFMSKYDSNFFTTPQHQTIAAYYRFFIPEIFPQYDKIIYLDCDMIILTDIADLYNIDIRSNLLGAVRDPMSKSNTHKNYIENILGKNTYKDYFNSGCLILDTKLCRNEEITDKLINKLIEVKNPKCVDQCIFNAVCDDKTYFLSSNWNYFCAAGQIINSFTDNKTVPKLEPYIIHFIGYRKPWENFGEELENSYFKNLWWQYARQTNFYNDILKQNKFSYFI